jgi:hypothetical protein
MTIRSIAFQFLVILSISIGSLANPFPQRWGLLSNNAPVRYGHQCVNDPRRHMLVLFGGKDSLGQMPSEIYELHDNWCAFPGNGPEGRIGHGMCYDTATHSTIVFGGINQAGEYLNDIWGWDGQTWVCYPPTNPPPPRAYFAMAYDSQRQRLLVFGGTNGDSVFGDTWEWTGTDWFQHATSGPPPRILPANVYLSTYDTNGQPSGGCLIFGGQNGFDGEVYNDTWEWNGVTWQQIQLNDPPAPRVGSDIKYYRTSFYVLFGGQNAFNSDSVLGDTWYYRTDNYYPGWSHLYLYREPSPRTMGALAQSHDGKMYYIGGKNEAKVFSEVWQFPYPEYVVGDVNSNDILNGLDVVYGVNFFKGYGPPPPRVGRWPDCEWYVCGDVNGSCTFSGLDISYMVRYFKGGAAPIPCPACTP